MGWWILNTTPNVSLPLQDSHDWDVVKFAATDFNRNRIYRTPLTVCADRNHFKSAARRLTTVGFPIRT